MDDWKYRHHHTVWTALCVMLCCFRWKRMNLSTNTPKKRECKWKTRYIRSYTIQCVALRSKWEKRRRRRKMFKIAFCMQLSNSAVTLSHLFCWNEAENFCTFFSVFVLNERSEMNAEIPNLNQFFAFVFGFRFLFLLYECNSFFFERLHFRFSQQIFAISLYFIRRSACIEQNSVNNIFRETNLDYHIFRTVLIWFYTLLLFFL